MQPELLLKSLTGWFAYHQSKALETGRKLNRKELDLALLIGCVNPKEVRLVFCSEMPMVKSPALLQAFGDYDFHLGDATGLCLGYGIFIHESQKGDRRILAHELTHTVQFERFGGAQAFLTEYVSQFLKFGYHRMPLETEARKNERFGKTMR